MNQNAINTAGDEEVILVAKSLQRVYDPKSISSSKVDLFNLNDEKHSSRLSKKSMAKFVSLTIRNAVNKLELQSFKELVEEKSELSMKDGIEEEALEDGKSLSQ